MSAIKIETVSLVTTDNKENNLANYRKYIDDAGANGVQLLVLPEYSSTGLAKNISMNYISAEEKELFEKNAEPVPEGETVKMIIERANKYNMYVAWTMIERDKFYTDRIYNTAVLVGPEGYVGSYRKVHRAGTEKMMFLAGDKGSDVFDTSIGKIGFIICFDKTYPDTVRALKLKGAEIIINPTAWPGLDQRLGKLDLSMQFHRYAGRCRAMENGVFYVDCNLGCNPEDKMNAEGGHARIMTPAGEILAETGWNEEKIVVTADPQASIAEYYEKMGITEEQHLDMLKKRQRLHDKAAIATDVAMTNIRFYGSALCNTLMDLPTAWKVKGKLK